MRRREFLGVVAGATAAWPLVARAQQRDRMRRVAVFVGGTETDPEQGRRMAAFQQAVRNLGWIEGRNITIDSHYSAGETARIQPLARELIDLKYDVIVAATTPVVAALLRETSTIPIVFVVVSDPVGNGFVASLPRPGGNVTGFINIEDSLAGKWLGLLKEIAPRVTRVALMFNPETAPQWQYYLRPFESAAHAMAVEPIAVRIHNDAEIEQAIATLALEPRGGLIVMPDFFLSVHRKRIIAQADHHKVPTIYPFPYFAREGGLASYGIDLVDSYRRAASYVDRILKDDKPAVLPVQQPTKFELIINLKVAKALGLEIPPKLLFTADEVIE